MLTNSYGELEKGTCTKHTSDGVKMLIYTGPTGYTLADTSGSASRRGCLTDPEPMTLVLGEKSTDESCPFRYKQRFPSYDACICRRSHPTFRPAAPTGAEVLLRGGSPVTDRHTIDSVRDR